MIAERLSLPATRRGHSAKPVVISAVATNALFFGIDAAARSEMVAALGALAVDDPERFTTAYRALWNAQTVAYPYLRGHLGPFTDWLDRDTAEGTHVRALGEALIETTRMDLHASAESPTVAGDLLGQVLMAVEASGDRKARGAFYTPSGLAGLLADISAVSDFETFTDPCCGAGGLAIATLRSMRRAGHHPATVTWTLNDLDRTAVACAGVAMAIHGMPHVHLTTGDALAPPEANQPGARPGPRRAS